MNLLPGENRLYRYSLSLGRSLLTPSIIYLVIVGNALLLACAGLFYRFESSTNPNVANFFDAIWWAFATVTTVGYGDLVPVTVEGRIVSIILMISGAVIFFGFTAILISVFTGLTREEVIETERLSQEEYADLVKRFKKLDSAVANISAKINSMKAEQSEE